MQKKFIGLMLILFGASTLQAQPLSQVVDLAMKQNHLVQVSRLDTLSTDLERRAAWRSLLPRIQLDASYRHVTDVARLQFPATVPFRMPDVNLGVYDSYDAGLSANYVLFSGWAQQNQVKMKREQKHLSTVQLDQARRETAFSVISAYRGVQMAGLRLDILIAAQKRVEQQKRKVAELVQQGMALPIDSLSLSLAELDYKQKIISAMEKKATASDRLDKLVGQPVQVDTILSVVVPGELPLLQISSQDQLESIAIHKRMAETGVRMQKAGYFPQVVVQAAYKYGKPGVDMIQNKWMAYGVWGIGLNWNLFSWGSDRLQVQAKQVQVRKTDIQKQILQDQIELKYEEALRQFDALRQSVEVARRAFEISRKKLAITRSQYEQGMSSATDFNRSNLEQVQAELNYRLQKLQLTLKYTEIEYLSGKPLNQWSIK